MTPQYRPHLIAKGEMHEALFGALRAAGSSLRVSSEGSVRLGDHDVPMPDIIVWEMLRGPGAVPGERVRLAVEVSDTTAKDDLGPKRALYAAAPIPEYWVVDLPARAVRQFWAPVDALTGSPRRCRSARRSAPRPCRRSPCPPARWTGATPRPEPRPRSRVPRNGRAVLNPALNAGG